MATKPRNRRAEILAEWHQTATATAANAEELAHLENHRLSLEQLYGELQTLSIEQDVLAASRQEVSKRIAEVLTEGNRTAAFMRTGARQHFGPDSEKLVEFGIKPFRGIRRRKPEPELPEEPAEPPPVSPIE
jgi:hypothetical protein